MRSLQLPATRLTLIGALNQGIRWEEFVAAYGPIILCWAEHDFGLQAADAEDVRQAVLLRVWRNVQNYNASKGRFRSWLYVCVRNIVLNWHRDRHGEWVGDGRVLWNTIEFVPSSTRPDGNLDDAVRGLEEQGFEHEKLRETVARVRRRVQPATWKAFLLFEFFAMRAKDIGPRLSMTPVAVNQAVHRVRQLLLDACSPVDSIDD